MSVLTPPAPPPGWVPNQHGAWGMLAGPFLVGTLAAEPRWVHLPLSLPSGLATIIAACLMTVVAYDADGGSDWARAWTLTAVLAAYFVGTLLYVKTMIRERDRRGCRAGG